MSTHHHSSMLHSLPFYTAFAGILAGLTVEVNAEVARRNDSVRSTSLFIGMFLTCSHKISNHCQTFQDSPHYYQRLTPLD